MRSRGTGVGELQGFGEGWTCEAAPLGEWHHMLTVHGLVDGSELAAWAPDDQYQIYALPRIRSKRPSSYCPPGSATPTSRTTGGVGRRGHRPTAMTEEETHMVQLTMVIAGVGTGLLCRTWRQAWVITVTAFVVMSAVQTPLVLTGDDIDSPLVYWTVQAASLAFALGIARVLFGRRHGRVRNRHERADLT